MIAPLAELVRIACQLECEARKPGNVHPEASFADLTYRDFFRSAEVIAPALARAGTIGVGQAIYDAVKATRDAVGTNTNLGMILLLAPLAAIPDSLRCQEGIHLVLNAMSSDDTRLVYAAIRLAQPGGLGKVEQEDVSSEPTGTLLNAMKLAADRDLIARQYSNGFADVLGFGRDCFLSAQATEADWEQAVIKTQLQLMARYPDSLIARKCGIDVALESQIRARNVLSTMQTSQSRAEMKEFDEWLRADGHRRNPGTTADLIAAILFAVLRDGEWLPPVHSMNIAESSRLTSSMSERNCQN